MESLNAAKVNLVKSYIKKIDILIEHHEPSIIADCDIIELLSEIISVFDKDINNLQDGLLLNDNSEVRDANAAKGMLIKYLADHGIEYKEDELTKNINVKRFWKSFITWFETELPDLKMLKDKYLIGNRYYDGSLALDINYDYEFKLYRGTEYPESLINETADIADVKSFIEVAYKHWIINDQKCHYAFTIEVNDRLKLFKLPYKLQSGILIKEGYKTTYHIDKIVNYKMFDRKIRFSEEMITNKDLMEKKSALDFIVDALQYLISIQDGNRKTQYAELASSVCSDKNGKVWTVIKQELNELMKLSNEFFDIRHNDYLNAAKEKREALNDPQFIEYLYNRVYAIVYLLRLKFGNMEE